MIPEKPGYYYYQWRPDEEIIVQVFDQGGVLESSLGRVDAEACRGRWLGAVPGRKDVVTVPGCHDCPLRAGPVEVKL